MKTQSPENRNEDRRAGKWRAIAAVLAALPAAFFMLAGGVWLFLVIRDRLLFSGPRSMLLKSLDTLLDPALILLASLVCVACALALARWRSASRIRRLALASVAVLPPLLVGGYAACWLVDRLLLKSIALFPSDVMLRAGGLAIAMLSAAATVWLALKRR